MKDLLLQKMLIPLKASQAARLRELEILSEAQHVRDFGNPEDQLQVEILEKKAAKQAKLSQKHLFNAASVPIGDCDTWRESMRARMNIVNRRAC